MTTSSLTGNGTIRANGGRGYGTGGGGGRVAIVLTGSDSFDSVAFQAFGGANESLDLGPADTELEVGELTVHGTAYTKSGTYTATDWNGTPTPSGITGDGAILITARGTLFLLR